jgi:hypothetical protein
MITKSLVTGRKRLLDTDSSECRMNANNEKVMTKIRTASISTNVAFIVMFAFTPFIIASTITFFLQLPFSPAQTPVKNAFTL